MLLVLLVLLVLVLLLVRVLVRVLVRRLVVVLLLHELPLLCRIRRKAVLGLLRLLVRNRKLLGLLVRELRRILLLVLVLLLLLLRGMMQRRDVLVREPPRML